MQDLKTGAFIGQKGVKYGLQRPAAKAAPTKAAAPRLLNIFGSDDSDEDDVASQLARQAEKKKRDAKVAQLQAEALAQDSNSFAYDEVYEEMQASKEQPRLQEKAMRKPKYIEMLLRQAEERKKEQDIGYEKRQVKEREKEDYLFKGKEKFVTSAYRKKLEEDKKWLEEERLRELEEEKHDVRKIGHMGNFYKNLLTQNVAFGTAMEKAAASKTLVEDKQAEVKAEGSTEPDAKVLAKACQMEKEMDKYERMRLEAERTYRERAKALAGEDGGEREQGSDGEARDAEVLTTKKERQEPTSSKPASMTADTGAVSEAPNGKVHEASAGARQALTGGRRKADDAAVTAAKERYLARKKSRTVG